MRRSGYALSSLEEKKHVKLRLAFDSIVDTGNTFTIWTMDVLETIELRKDR